VTISKSSIIGNTSWAGGGIYAAPGTLMIVANTTIARNKADEAGVGTRFDASDGAAIFIDDADANLIGTAIRDNEGRSQLAANGASSIVAFDNSIVWGLGSKYNCFGNGSYFSMSAGSFQSKDIKDGSCPFPVLNAPDSALFAGAAIFDDPLPPPDLPLEHIIWIPSTGSQLIGAGNVALCDDPMAQNGEDEIGNSRSTCDIGAIESP
jgi:hypothetical protein